MITIKTAALQGPALDWAVSEIEGVRLWPFPQDHGLLEIHFSEEQGCTVYSPSTDWGQGGPLTVKHQIDTSYQIGDECWCATYYMTDECIEQYGPTPLVAALLGF